MRRITGKDVYDALADQLSGPGCCHFIDDYKEGDDLKYVTVDGQVDCNAMAGFLESKVALIECPGCLAVSFDPTRHSSHCPVYKAAQPPH